MMDVAGVVMVLYLLFFFFGDDGLRVVEIPFVWQHFQQLSFASLSVTFNTPIARNSHFFVP